MQPKVSVAKKFGYNFLFKIQSVLNKTILQKTISLKPNFGQQVFILLQMTIHAKYIFKVSHSKIQVDHELMVISIGAKITSTIYRDLLNP